MVFSIALPDEVPKELERIANAPAGRAPSDGN
jgi:predicted transcriptional regulator